MTRTVAISDSGAPAVALAATAVALLLIPCLSACQRCGKQPGATDVGTPDAVERALDAEPPLGKGALRGHNVILLSVDTLRADHIGAYGYPSPTTPHLDQLAAESVVFDNAFAPRAHTWPALTSMLTAMYPIRTGVRGPGELLAPEIQTAVAMMEQAGYDSAAFLANFCKIGRAVFKHNYCKTYDDAGVTKRAIAWLQQPHARPFFLWVHLMTPHSDFRPKASFNRFTDPNYRGPLQGNKKWLHKIFAEQLDLSAADLAQLIGLYDGDVLWADDFVGQLLRAIRARGQLERSLLVFTSDHGEELYQHYKFIEHGCSIHDASLRVPMMLRLPGGALGGQRRGAAVGLLDLMPTLFDLLGLAPSASFDGESFVPALLSDRDKDFPAVISEHYRTQQAGQLLSIRTRRWRYIYNPQLARPFCIPVTAHYKVAREELYDHEADPREQRNVVDKHPDVAAELRREMLQRYPQPASSQPTRLADDRETLEALKSLGYVGE